MASCKSSRRSTAPAVAAKSARASAGLHHNIVAASDDGAITTAHIHRSNLRYELRIARVAAPMDSTATGETFNAALVAYEEATVALVDALGAHAVGLDRAEFVEWFSGRLPELKLLWEFQAAVSAEFDAYRKACNPNTAGLKVRRVVVPRRRAD